MNEKAKKDLSIPEQIAIAITSVQPMPDTCISDLYKSSKTEETLKNDGFEPVSKIGLLWIKQEQE